jgi:hypothetical protein
MMTTPTEWEILIAGIRLGGEGPNSSKVRINHGLLSRVSTHASGIYGANTQMIKKWIMVDPNGSLATTHIKVDDLLTEKK